MDALEDKRQDAFAAGKISSFGAGVQNCSSNIIPLVLLLSAVSPLSVVGSPKYPIQLGRAVKVGDSHNVRIKFHSQATKKLKTANGQDKKFTQGFDLDFAGIQDVLSVWDGSPDRVWGRPPAS